MPNSITIHVPDGFDSFELAVLNALQPALDARRAALTEHTKMDSLGKANTAGFAAWQHAVQILSGDPNNVDFMIAELQTRVAYTVAYNAFQAEFKIATNIDSARVAAYVPLHDAVPGLLVNPGAVEAV